MQMLKEYIHYVFSYNKIYKLLLSYNYTPDECRAALRNIRRMDVKVLNAFLHWVATSEYPKGYLNDVSVKDLVEVRKMPPPAAFLTADWMGKDVAAAAHFVSHGLKDDSEVAMPAIEIPEDIQERVTQLEKNEEPEDESPFESPEQS